MWQPQGFYNEYVLRSPIILSGKSAVRGLYNYPASRIAVIHGTSFGDEDLFSSTFIKREVRFFARSWKDEPDLQGLKKTISELEMFKPDVIISVGGGSVIDGSKLCRLYYEFPFFDPKNSRLSGQMLKSSFIAIPTTIGSGAEVSSAAVYRDTDRRRKDMIVMHELQADVVVYDPCYVSSTPHSLLCASALDAMGHILEGYVSNINNSFIDMLAEKGLSILIEELQAIVSGGNIDYSRLQYVGYIGGLVQNHCLVGAAHAVAHQLTELGYSHSEAVALLLPAVIRTNMLAEHCKHKYNRIAKYANLESIDNLVLFINRVVEYTGILDRRNALKKYLLDMLGDTAFCENVKKDRGGKGNPVEINDDYLKTLIGSM